MGFNPEQGGSTLLQNFSTSLQDPTEMLEPTTRLHDHVTTSKTKLCVDVKIEINYLSVIIK
jgi:hypothetical protein